MMYVFYAALSVLAAVLLTLMSYKMFQIYQLSSYRSKGFWNWLKITKFDYAIRYFAAAFFIFIAMFVYVFCFYPYRYVRFLGLLFYPLFGILFIVLTMRQKSKTPLVLTMRALRLIVVTFLLYAAAAFGLFLLGRITPLKYSLAGILPVLIPLIATLGYFITLPFELLNNWGYRRRAEKKLAGMPGLIRIGITGSYGKTTAKNILAKMLETKYKVCFSPASYNTPMGISKVVNNQLAEDDQIFIAEMGARNRGDIAELANIVNPNYGLITSIGNQHLETFGSREAIIDTKFELIESLVAGGLAVFNADSPDTVGMYARTKGAKLLTGDKATEGANIYYDEVRVGTEGTAFTLYVSGQPVRIATKLLGKHIPSLIALCAAVANALGVSGEQIAGACAALEAVPHRLQLIENGNTIVIDDAYNSNTEGAKNALLILKEFDRTRIVITPGMVELGTEEKVANTEFGRQIASCADYAFLVGARAEDIKAGAIEAGMAEDKITVTATLAEAVEQQAKMQGAKAVLFENDLPDNY